VGYEPLSIKRNEQVTKCGTWDEYYEGEEDEMGAVCSMYKCDEKFIQNFIERT
jgi:hypothetical protein